MLKNPSSVLKSLFWLLLCIAHSVSAENSAIRVVTSFSILNDLVNELGGNHVSVANLVGRNSDAHMYQPKPSDAVAIANADLVVFNGLGFEGWITRLIENSGYQNAQLIASEGVNAIENSGEVDPHAWQSFKNIRVYLHNITQSLITLRPDHADEFQERHNKYLAALRALEDSLIKEMARIDENKRIVVTSHDSFGYLGRELNIRFLAPLGLSLEDEASAEDVAIIIDQIREQDVQAIFVGNINNPRLLELIAAETQVAIGGRLYSDALSEVDGPANTYLRMMQHNIESLIKTFTKN